MPLNSLPAEFVITVADLLDPFSLFDFALTCKSQWILCNAITAKHKRLFAENRTIDATDRAWPYENHILWDKLKEISEHPSVGEYVRDMSLPSRRAVYLQGDVSHEFQLTAESARALQEDIDLFIPIARQMEDLYGPEFNRDSWEDQVLKGSSEPIIVMLVHCMPYLKIFRFTDLETSKFMESLQMIAKAYPDPVLAPKLPFQCLVTVAVTHWDTEMSCDPDWCLFFCAIPSVRNFVASAMGGDISEDAQQGLPKSNVKEIVFDYSRFETHGIEEIVRNAPKLERFSYEVAGATVAEDVMPTPKRDLKALVDHTGHSLQHLVFDYPHIDCDDHIDSGDLLEVSLRGFQKLKTLRIEWSLLWPSEDLTFDNEEESDGGFYKVDEGASTDFDVRSLLPESLEKLCLTGSFTSKGMEEFQRIRNSYSEFTPLLETIYTSLGTFLFENEEVPGVHANFLKQHLEGQGHC